MNLELFILNQVLNDKAWVAWLKFLNFVTQKLCAAVCIW